MDAADSVHLVSWAFQDTRTDVRQTRQMLREADNSDLDAGQRLGDPEKMETRDGLRGSVDPPQWHPSPRCPFWVLASGGWPPRPQSMTKWLAGSERVVRWLDLGTGLPS